MNITTGKTSGIRLADTVGSITTEADTMLAGGELANIAAWRVATRFVRDRLAAQGGKVDGKTAERGWQARYSEALAETFGKDRARVVAQTLSRGWLVATTSHSWMLAADEGDLAALCTLAAAEQSLTTAYNVARGDKGGKGGNRGPKGAAELLAAAARQAIAQGLTLHEFLEMAENAYSEADDGSGED